MTAFSLGRDTASSGRIGLNDDDRGPVAKALGIITELIPGEAIAAYLAIVAAVAAFTVAPEQADFRPALNVGLAVPMGFLVSIAFAFIGAAKAIRDASDKERPGKIWRTLGYGVGTGALFIVYVIAMPGNPFEVLWDVQPAVGGLIAVLFTIGWGIGKAVWTELQLKPKS